MDYDQLTGLFTRKTGGHGVVAGEIAGGLDDKGYWVIRIFGKRYKAHRLAFLWMEGKFPPKIADHENRRRDDNSWGNLRGATYSENAANSICRKQKRLRIKGVFERNGRFRAIICANGKHIHLGTYDREEEAALAYADEAKKQFGEFARVA